MSKISLRTLFLFTVLTFVVVPLVAYAQSGPLDMSLYSIDYSEFPTVRIRMAPLMANGKVMEGLIADSVRVYEDGVQRPIVGLESKYIGTQIAFVFDASGSFKQPGVTDSKISRFDEAIQAIDELLLTDNWLQRELRLDHVMLMMPKGDKDFQVVQDWTTAYTTIHNAAYQSEPVGTDTPLLKMMQESMALMKNVPDYQSRPKFLVVLSDGVDSISAQDGSDVIQKANSLDVTILSIKIGPQGTGAARNLQRFAEETGGVYTNYTGVDALGEMFELVRSRTAQYEAFYRSSVSMAGRHGLIVAVMSEEKEYRSKVTEFDISLQPSVSIIFNPAISKDAPQEERLLDGEVFERVAARWDEDVNLVEPRGTFVSLFVTFPDGYVRDIDRVLYEIDGRIVASLSVEETKNFFWDFPDEPGTHEQTLRVIVRDIQGIEGISEPTKITINVIVPPRPEQSSVLGIIPGGKGHTVELLQEGAAVGRSTVAGDEGGFSFEGLAAGVYFVRDKDRGRYGIGVDAGNTIGPFELDGELHTVAQIEFTEVTIVELLATISPTYWFLLILAITAVGLAIYAIIKKPPIVQDMAQSIVGAVRDATEPFRPKRGRRRSANAYLIPIIDDAGRRGDPIALRAQTSMIGRDPSRAQVVFSDKSVSRLHARIVEESDGVFVLHDEGSSSGTFLNEQQVTHEPQKLRSGDEIEFGRVRVIFQAEVSDDVTEPFRSKA